MMRIPLARKSWPYIISGILITVTAWIIHWIPGLLLSVPTILLINFFKDPNRKPPDLASEYVLSPADGKVISIEQGRHKDFPDHVRISIFMNIFDVHVNRVPVDGVLRSLYHYPGLFLPADNPRAPGENERMEFTLSTSAGPILVSLVAGLVARRVFSWARPDDTLLRGQRFAMIKLGSRVDVHLPPGTLIQAQPGLRVKAGLTPIARLQNNSDDTI
ncbi:MAG: phosphatidylserine decarboxylase [bacterium]